MNKLAKFFNRRKTIIYEHIYSLKFDLSTFKLNAEYIDTTGPRLWSHIVAIRLKLTMHVNCKNNPDSTGSI